MTRRSSTAPQHTADIHYRLSLHDPAAHLFEVELTVAVPDADGQMLSLPAWIPGSYMIREFARHVVAITAHSGTRRVALTKLDKHSWQAARCNGPLTVRYQVYAWDLSVRTAHFDDSHAFFNGTSVFLRVIGREQDPVTLELAAPADPRMAGWQVATTLACAGARRWEFGRYRAANYDELVDHPVEIGRFTRASFRACGVEHDLVITGCQDADTGRLCADLVPVCEAQIRLFEPRTAAAPFERYLFLVMAVGDGYGGLEHRASTALICNRNDLPFKGQSGVSDGYRRFLGLCSHEYFHSWNVKRIKPAAFVPYDLDRENYTRLLWIFEGFTSYYDDLMLVRAGVISVDDYLKTLAETISTVQRAPGRTRQSVAESSFEAWSKYYRQDEQSPNSIVSYYTKGSLVALLLDLAIRVQSAGKRSLDDVMRLLWKQFGRHFDQAPAGLTEDGFAALVTQATGIDLGDEIRRWAYGTDELPLAQDLAKVGLKLDFNPADKNPWLGVRSAQRGADLTLTTVLTGGPAHKAGLSAGDVLLAIDKLRMDDKSLRQLLARHVAGDRITVHVFRRDELREYTLKLATAPATEASLSRLPKPSARTAALLRGWLKRHTGA